MKEFLSVVFITLAFMYLAVSLTVDVIDYTTKLRAVIKTNVNKHTVCSPGGGYVTYSAVRRFSAVKPY
jgi:hypothetical protein